MKKTLSVPEKHQLKIAYQTLKMTPVMARIMGGMTYEEAKEVIRKLTGKKISDDEHMVPEAKAELGAEDDKPFFEMSTISGVAGFNGPVGKKKNERKINEIKTLTEILNEVDLSKIPGSAANWLEKNFPKINKIYKNKEELLKYIEPMHDVSGIGEEWYSNFVDNIKRQYQKGPESVLKYIYNAYLAGSGMSTKMNENLTLTQGLNKEWLSLPGIHDFFTRLGGKKLKDSGDWEAMYKLGNEYFVVIDEDGHFKISEEN